MTGEQIQPHKVTKPIQLLAAWLIGLVLTVGLFLATALKLEPDSWERGALVIAAIVDVPLFLYALFLLQTKFRAELQEDSFYSEYLSKKTAALVHIEKGGRSRGVSPVEPVSDVVGAASVTLEGVTASITGTVSPIPWLRWRVGLNALHPKATEIAHALQQEGIPIAEMFGTGELPGEWVISLAHELPMKDAFRVLKAALKFGFAGFSFWDPEHEAGETEHIYIGSYATRKYIPATNEMLQLVAGEFDEVAFRVQVAKFSIESSYKD